MLYTVIYASSDFPNAIFDESRLHQEIQANPVILTALEGVSSNGGNCEITFKTDLDAAELEGLNALIATHTGAPIPQIATPVSIPGLKATADNKLVVSVWPTEGSRTNLISHNWCDPTTWYTSSIRIEDEVLTANTEGAFVLAQTSIIDLTHGKIFGEDSLEGVVGRPLKLSMKVGGTPIVEVDPDFGGGDFTLDYATGIVTFTAGPPSEPITVSYNYATDSKWYLAPTPGKILRLKEVEVQFSMDCSIRDTVQFQPQGQAQYFAPQLVAAGYLAPTDYIPLVSATRYKTMKDFLDESNGSLPPTPKTTNSAPTWRDLPESVITLPWDYQATINLLSSKGMRIEVRLLNDRPYSGAFATSTFYALSDDE